MSDQTQLEKRPTLEAYPVELREKSFQFFKLGITHRENAKLVLIPEGTVASWAKRFKWRERKLAESAAVAVTVPTPTDPTQGEATSLTDSQRDYERDMIASARRLPAIIKLMSDKEYIANADKIAKADATNRKALKLESDKPNVLINVALLAGTEKKRTRPVIPDIVATLLPPHSLGPSVEGG